MASDSNRYTDEERAELRSYGFTDDEIDGIGAFEAEQERHRGDVTSKMYERIRAGKGAWMVDPRTLKKIREGGEL